MRLQEENGVHVNEVKMKDRSRDSPSKRVKAKTKAMSPDEWLKKLEAEEHDDDETAGADQSSGGNAQPQRASKSRTSGKKKKQGGDGTELTALNSRESASNGAAGGHNAPPSSDGPLKQFRSPKGELVGPTPSAGKGCCQCCTIL